MRSREMVVEKQTAGLVSVEGKAFPLEREEIHARAQGGIAQTILRQLYRNPYAEPLEVTYTLPLPADGAVTGFDIHVGEKVIAGEIEAHDKALKKYREALEAGRMAGILEQERADTFTQNLGNVPPGMAVDVEIRVMHPAAFHAAVGTGGAEWEYRFPTVVGVRYEGAPGRVPDRDRLDVDRADSGGVPARLAFDLEIGDGAPAVVIPRSTSHEIRVEDATRSAVEGGSAPATTGGTPHAAAALGATLVRFETPSRLDRDVTVRWCASTQETELRLLEGTGLMGDDGRYGLLTIVPPSRPEQTIPRDLTILIDASGSMSGPSIDTAREMSIRLVSSLRAGDRFQVLAFSNDVVPIVGEPTEATSENIARAGQALARLAAGGATEMQKAVEAALRPLRGDSQRQVILMTDGYIGFEQEIVERILNHLPRGARLHVIGIGGAPNRTLTRGASRAGRGLEVLVAGTDGVEEASTRLLAATVAPVLTDLAIEGSAVVAVAPERPRDVLAGQPAVVALELHPRGGEIRVRGTVTGPTGAGEEWIREVPVAQGRMPEVPAREEPGRDAPNSTGPTRPRSLPIGAFFGREAIEDEEMRLAASRDESREILERIEALGLRHRITSRCTTLVAVADEPSVDPQQARRRQRLPVEMPAGVSPEAVGHGGERAMPMALDRTRAISHLVACPSRPAAPIEVPRPEIQARCVRTEGDLLVIEFESPRKNYGLPLDGSAMTAMTEDGEELEISIDKKLSTSAGPHDRGLTLRLAIRRVDGASWRSGRVRLVPTSRRGAEIVIDIK